MILAPCGGVGGGGAWGTDLQYYARNFGASATTVNSACKQADLRADLRAKARGQHPVGVQEEDGGNSASAPGMDGSTRNTKTNLIRTSKKVSTPGECAPR